MAKRNKYTEAVLRKGEKISKLEERQHKEVPFGQDDVSLSELRSRMKTMNREGLAERTSEERQAHLDNVGADAFLAQVSKGIENDTPDQLRLRTPEERATHLKAIGAEAFLKQAQGGGDARE